MNSKVKKQFWLHSNWMWSVFQLAKFCWKNWFHFMLGRWDNIVLNISLILSFNVNSSFLFTQIVTDLLQVRYDDTFFSFQYGKLKKNLAPLSNCNQTEIMGHLQWSFAKICILLVEYKEFSQPAFTCSKLAIETLE